MAKRIFSITAHHVTDTTPDTSYLQQPEFSDRLAQYEADAFYFIGIDACAKIEIAGTQQTIVSGGLWGIESDSDKEYMASVEAEEISSLTAILLELGFTAEEISTAARQSNCTHAADARTFGDGNRQCVKCGASVKVVNGRLVNAY